MPGNELPDAPLKLPIQQMLPKIMFIPAGNQNSRFTGAWAWPWMASMPPLASDDIEAMIGSTNVAGAGGRCQSRTFPIFSFQWLGGANFSRLNGAWISMGPGYYAALLKAIDRLAVPITHYGNPLPKDTDQRGARSCRKPRSLLGYRCAICPPMCMTSCDPVGMSRASAPDQRELESIQAGQSKVMQVW